MDGYHRTDEQLTELDDGDWKSVGDVAYVDDEGYVYICDRKKDMIISGGVNIYPAEIEAVLYAHPQVLDAAVFGIPDDEWGERVHAIVQAKPGETIDLDELARVRRAAARALQAPARLRAARRAAAHRLRQAAEARAPRRVLDRTTTARSDRDGATAASVPSCRADPLRSRVEAAAARATASRCSTSAPSPTPTPRSRRPPTLGFPVVVKLCGDAIAHKTERGLVRLGLRDADAVRDAAARAARRGPARRRRRRAARRADGARAPASSSPGSCATRSSARA